MTASNVAFVDSFLFYVDNYAKFAYIMLERTEGWHQVAPSVL